MIRLNVGDTQVVPLFLPGATLTIGGSTSLAVNHWDSIAARLAEVPTALEVSKGDLGALIVAAAAVLLLSLYVVSMVVGSLISIVGGYVESLALDRIAARRLGLSLEQYWEQWQRYLDHIDRRKNPYISSFVDLFLFSLRTGLALLGVSLMVWAVNRPPCWMPLTGLGAALLLLWSAQRDHWQLADRRNRNHATSGPTDDEESAPEAEEEADVKS